MGDDVCTFEYSYKPELLKTLDISKYKSKFSLDVGPNIVPDHLLIRPMRKCDFEHGYLELLSKLTTVGDVSVKQFNDQFDKIKACPNTYYITVIQDRETWDVVGTGTLLIEHKFIHSCAARGRIEDIVIMEKYRGLKLGQLLIATLSILAEKLGCYKVSLDCKDAMIPYYSKLNFVQEPNNANFLQMRLKN
ncbi:probable glucosamine 6-phosphate N-acetyltransferase [Nilaparvata lugens]|uniref:probable glucosamine 6-phosphate N-acetyltransferase n=1 Tax=Nilaparvata lugens TaxID=108931 RepID=UPI000B98F769|nr:probable glucosamine 6-phosphate N-acetyltransferase [Nilaparvata lugens]